MLLVWDFVCICTPDSFVYQYTSFLVCFLFCIFVFVRQHLYEVVATNLNDNNATRLAVRVMHRSGVRLSLCPIFFPALIGRAAHTQRDAPENSTRRGQRTFPSEY